MINRRKFLASSAAAAVTGSLVTTVARADALVSDSDVPPYLDIELHGANGISMLLDLWFNGAKETAATAYHLHDGWMRRVARDGNGKYKTRPDGEGALIETVRGNVVVKWNREAIARRPGEEADRLRRRFERDREVWQQEYRRGYWAGWDYSEETDKNAVMYRAGELHVMSAELVFASGARVALERNGDRFELSRERVNEVIALHGEIRNLQITEVRGGGAGYGHVQRANAYGNGMRAGRDLRAGQMVQVMPGGTVLPLDGSQSHPVNLAGASGGGGSTMFGAGAGGAGVVGHMRVTPGAEYRFNVQPQSLRGVTGLEHQRFGLDLAGDAFVSPHMSHWPALDMRAQNELFDSIMRGKWEPDTERRHLMRLACVPMPFKMGKPVDLKTRLRAKHATQQPVARPLAHLKEVERKLRDSSPVQTVQQLPQFVRDTVKATGRELVQPFADVAASVNDAAATLAREQRGILSQVRAFTKTVNDLFK